MSIPTNKVGILMAEIDTGGALRSAGDRVILGARDAKSEQEWMMRQKITKCAAKVTDAVHEHGGVIANRTARAIFSTFPNARNAFRAACFIQRGHHRDINETAATTTVALGLRLGLTFGKMIVDAGQITGDTVEMARQIALRTSPGQIFAAENAVNAVGDEVSGYVKSLGAASFENVHGETEIFEVNWNEEGASGSSAYTETVPIVDSAPPSARLMVNLRGKELVLDESNPIVSLRSGKQGEPHARLEYRNGSFYLVNLRVSGTRIKPVQGDEQLCLDEIELTGEGAIRLSDVLREGKTENLLFSCLS